MIKAIITDVDGVIVGKKHGINFPLPNAVVIKKLQALHDSGIPVVLNTAKFNKAVLEIIKSAGLSNPHITDGGALILDPLENKVIRKHIFEKQLAKEIIQASLLNGFYTEFYGADEWFIQQDQRGEFSKKRVRILQSEHTSVSSLADHADGVDVIKIFTFIHNREDKPVVEKFLAPFSDKITVVWSHHPTTYPSQNAIITLKNVSKKDATIEVLDYLQIDPKDALGIGDTLGDWQFMNVCGYVGVTGSTSRELINQARTKGKSNFFLADDADNDGFLAIIDHFFA